MHMSSFLWDKCLKYTLQKQLHDRCFKELLDHFLNGCSILHSHQQGMKNDFPTSFPVFGVVNMFNFSHAESC